MKIEYFDLDNSTLSIPVPENYGDCICLISSYLYRFSGGVNSAIKIILKGLLPLGRNVLFWFRMASYRKGRFWWFCKLMYKIASWMSHVEIPPGTKVGYGLYMGHNMCIVINEGTIIGNNVNISQFLNIGTNENTPAIIGDNVYIGPHVCIVENVHIGNNSTIGAGAVITRDIPENATVAGVPAKVLNYDNPGRYVGFRYKP